jgi:hypothetical protein
LRSWHLAAQLASWFVTTLRRWRRSGILNVTNGRHLYLRSEVENERTPFSSGVPGASEEGGRANRMSNSEQGTPNGEGKDGGPGGMFF